MGKCKVCGGAVVIAEQESIGEFSIVHFAGVCNRCGSRFKWQQMILGPPGRLPVRFSGRTACPPDCPRHSTPV